MPGLADAWSELADLILPTGCAGCAATGTRLAYGVCSGCAAALEDLVPAPARPTPAPPGLPPTTSLGGYDGVLREALLAYKERGRHGLAAPLGGLLAEAVGGGRRSPDARGDDPGAQHRAARAAPGTATISAGWPLRRPAACGRPAGRRSSRGRCGRSRGPTPPRWAAPPARRPWPEHFGSRRQRIARLRGPVAGATVVVLDDVITTGATLAEVAGVLARAGVPVAAAAVLAATRRRALPHLGGGFPTPP